MFKLIVSTLTEKYSNLTFITLRLKFSASVSFIHKESVIMHGHTIVKFMFKGVWKMKGIKIIFGTGHYIGPMVCALPIRWQLYIHTHLLPICCSFTSLRRLIVEVVKRIWNACWKSEKSTSYVSLIHKNILKS
jgi:hypothetical protein